MEVYDKNKTVSLIKNRINLRFSLLLSTFLLLLVTSYSLSSVTISSKKHDSLLLNRAGLQRMLIRQYVSEINQSLIGLAASNMDITLKQKRFADLTAKRFEKTLEAFLNGGEIIVTTGWVTHVDIDNEIELTKKSILIPPIKNVTTRTHITHTLEEWFELKRIASLSLRSNRHEILHSPHLISLIEQTKIVSLHMDHVVSVMQSDSEERLEQLSFVILVMLVMGIVLFVLLVLFVRINIVNPLGESIYKLHETTEQLETQKITAEKANDAKSEFLSCMSHELRTPLNAILGFSQLLDIEADELSEIQAKNVKEIIYAGHHLLKLINDILDLSKVESGNLDVFIEEVDLDYILKQSVPLIHSMAESRQIDVKDNISGKGYFVEADKMRLKQVMLNLLSNAVKYNNDHCQISIDADLVGNNRIRINVTDNGNGISKKDINKLFIPFERLDKVTNIEGTGIGLVISKRFIEMMAGAIGVDSTPGLGSTFWIELDLVKQGQ